MLECWACGEPVVADTGDLACGACGLRFAPARAEETVHGLYDDEYFQQYAGGDYDEQEAARRYEAGRRLALLRRRAAPGRLLEVGPAAGYFLEAALAAGWSGFGIEPAAGVAERARARGLDVRTGYLEGAALPAAQLDVVCAWHVIEHIPEPLDPVTRIRAALRPGGQLLLEVPNIASITAQRMGPAWPHLDPAHHVAHFTPAAMRALLARAGFAPIDVWTFPGSAYLPAARLLHPRQLAAAAREALRIRALPRRPHRWRHELIRAVAVRP
jgi:SAM-dependent methyltransferase